MSHFGPGGSLAEIQVKQSVTLVCISKQRENQVWWCIPAIPALLRLFAISKVKELFLPTYTFEVETFERIYTRKLTEIAAGRRLT